MNAQRAILPRPPANGSWWTRTDRAKWALRVALERRRQKQHTQQERTPRKDPPCK